MTEDEMVGWHHQLSGYECQQTPGKSEGQGSVLQSMRSQRVEHNRATEQEQVPGQRPRIQYFKGG